MPQRLVMLRLLVLFEAERALTHGLGFRSACCEVCAIRVSFMYVRTRGKTDLRSLLSVHWAALEPRVVKCMQLKLDLGDPLFVQGRASLHPFCAIRSGCLA